MGKRFPPSTDDRSISSPTVVLTSFAENGTWAMRQTPGWASPSTTGPEVLGSTARPLEPADPLRSSSEKFGCFLRVGTLSVITTSGTTIDHKATSNCNVYL